jgi:DeoR/GlpR family transcriptional regulator of sugar metabolism
MLAIERRKKIMNLIQENKSVLVPELSRQFQVTEETIRRDLERMEKEGLLKRTHGGAVLSEVTGVEIPFNIREVTNIEGKTLIGQKIADYIEDGDTVILDSSSTALQVAKMLKNKKRLTVITNSEKVILELGNARQITLISTGGVLRQGSLSYTGTWAEKLFDNYNADKAVISCKGISIDKGITDSNEMEAQIKKAMFKSAAKVYIGVDHTKFDRVSFVKMLSIDDVDLIFTDRQLDLKWHEFLKEKNIEVCCCG